MIISVKNILLDSRFLTTAILSAVPQSAASPQPSHPPSSPHLTHPRRTPSLPALHPAPAPAQCSEPRAPRGAAQRAAAHQPRAHRADHSYHTLTGN